MNEVYINIKDMQEGWLQHKLEKWYPTKDLLSIDDLLGLIEDLAGEVDDLKDELEDLQQDLEDNYIPRPMSDYTGDRYDDRF